MVEMYCDNINTFGRRNLVKSHHMKWLDLRGKWSKSEWLADYNREMMAVNVPEGGDYKDYAGAQYSAAADWIDRNASVMPSEVRELFDDMPDGYNCPRAWLAWCPE